MTEKQALKLKGKKVRFYFREFKYAIRFEVIEGIVETEEISIHLIRDNTLKEYKHINLIIIDDKMKGRIIEWNKLKNIYDLEIIE